MAGNSETRPVGTISDGSEVSLPGSPGDRSDAVTDSEHESTAKTAGAAASASASASASALSIPLQPWRRKFGTQSTFPTARELWGRTVQPCKACRRRKTVCVITTEPPCAFCQSRGLVCESTAADAAPRRSSDNAAHLPSPDQKSRADPIDYFTSIYRTAHSTSTTRGIPSIIKRRWDLPYVMGPKFHPGTMESTQPAINPTKLNDSRSPVHAIEDKPDRETYFMDRKPSSRPAHSSLDKNVIAEHAQQAPIVPISEAIEASLSGPNAEQVTALLQQRFEEMASGEYAWLADLKAVGYTCAELGELLYERANDSPWIFFTPTKFVYHTPMKDHHLEDCAHNIFSSASAANYGSTSIKRLGSTQDIAEVGFDDQSLRRAIEELCGLGGVQPHFRDRTKWNGSVEFDTENTNVRISHGRQHEDHSTESDVLRLAHIGRRLGTAMAIVQKAGLCCNSLTIPRIDIKTSHIILECIYFDLIAELVSDLYVVSVQVLDHPKRRSPAMDNLYHLASQVIEMESTSALQHVSVALQVLCVGFLTYAQAHIGELRPFFLDTPLRSITLYGLLPLQSTTVDGLVVNARLVELTCLHGMCNGPVMAFEPATSVKAEPSAFDNSVRFDVSATVEDILDTWEPGELISLSEDGLPQAIRIGGGYIYASSGQHHWSRELDRREEIARSMSLKPGKKIVIGSMVACNGSCTNDENVCWEQSLAQFEELGTYKSRFEASAYELGIQGGPDHFNITGNRTWSKRRGKTVKTKILEQRDDMLVPFLDCYWGVRVSFCTGIAQRVLLRQLVGDLLPAFAKTLVGKAAADLWVGLEAGHGIICALQDYGTSIRDWLRRLSEEHCRFALSLIRHVLSTLEGTGLAPDATHFLVAWPVDGVVNRCFRVPLDGQNRWTPMLADSDDCATFAYITNVCLEAGSISCRGPNPVWQDKICLLETAVLCPARNETLQHEQTYFFHKLDNNLFWVKCSRISPPVALIRIDSVRSLPLDVMRRLMISEERKKQRRLREKDRVMVKAEVVAVWSQNLAYLQP